MPHSSGSIVELSQDRTTGSNDVGTKRLIPQNMSQTARRNAPTGPLHLPSWKSLELTADDSITCVEKFKETFHTKIFTHIYLVHHRTWLNDYNTHTKL